MSDNNCNKKQDMSDRARFVRQKLQKNARYMSDRARFVQQKWQQNALLVREHIYSRRRVRYKLWEAAVTVRSEANRGVYPSEG